MIDHILIISGWLIALIAMAVIHIRHNRKPDGAIVVNTDDPEKDTYTLELYIPFGELDRREDVKFKIIHL